MWSDLIREYGIDDPAGLKLLQSSCESYDLIQQCLQAIRDDGLMMETETGQKKPHPLLPTMRDARSSMLQALKSLNLDLEPLREKPGRPGGRG